MVTTIPTAFGTSFESTNAGRDTGFDSTHAAVPLLFSPTMASCIRMATAMAANMVMIPKSVNTVTSSGASPQMKAAREPLMTAVHNRDWMTHMRVRHHEPNAAPIRFDRPLRQPPADTRSSPEVPELLIIAAPLDQFDEDGFEVRRFSCEVPDHEPVVREKNALQLGLGGLRVRHRHTQSRRVGTA